MSRTPFLRSALVIACSLASTQLLADEVNQLAPLNVSAQRQASSVVESADSTGKSAVADDKLAMTIDKVDRKAIAQSQVDNVADAVSLLAGIQKSGINAYSFTSRGFAMTRDNVKIDGMNAWALKDNPVPLIALERVDVLKGVGSTLYGSQEVGGTVNLVTKKPQAESHHEIQLEGGYYGSGNTDHGIGARSLAFDSTGEMNDDGTLMYRVLGEYRNEDSFTEYQNRKGFYLSPMVTWQPDDKQSLTAQLELTHYNYDYPSALVAPGGDIKRVADLNTNYFGPQNDASDEGAALTLTYLRHLDNGWDSTTRWRSVSHRDMRGNFSVASVSDDTVHRRYRRMENHQLNHELDSYLTGREMTGDISHDLTVGATYAYTKEDFNRLAWGRPDAALDVDLYNPQFSHIDKNSLGVDRGNHRVYTYKTTSVYGQDVIGLTDKLNLQLGVRFDAQTREAEHLGYTRNNGTYVDGSSDKSREHYWTPTAGFSYQLTDDLTWHAGYSESYETTKADSLNNNGRPFDPEQGLQYETGLRYVAADNLSMELNLFHIRKQNIVVTDAAGNDSTLGQVMSKGAELTLDYQPTTDWTLKAAYTLMDTKVQKGDRDGGGDAGNEFINAPHQRLVLQSYYQMNQDWQLGAIVHSQTHSYGSTDNGVRLPGYTVVNLVSHHQLSDNAAVDLSLNNLFDREYYSAGKNANSIYAGMPRYLQARFSYQF